MRPWLDSWVRNIPWRMDRLLTPVFLLFPCVSGSRETACYAGGLGQFPGLGRSTFVFADSSIGKVYSCLGTVMCVGLFAKCIHLFWSPMDYSLFPRTGLSVPGISHGRILEWVPFSPPGCLCDPSMESASAALQLGSFLLSHEGSKDMSHF